MINRIKKAFGRDKRVFQRPVMGARELDPNTLIPYYLENLKYFQFKDKYKNVECPVVCVIDSGTNFEHNDIKDRYHEQIDFSGEGLIFLNATHGSHCSSIVSGDKFGLSTAPIADFKALDSSGSGTPYSIVQALKEAKNKGYEVISMSLGSDAPYYKMEKVLRSITEDNDKAFVICAAGNDGDQYSSDYPAEYSKIIPGVLSISASDSTKNGNFRIANFSARQETVSYIGVDVVSAGAVHNGSHKFKIQSGTSMAAPGVAALIALAKGIYPEFNQRDFHQILDESVVQIEQDEMGVLIPELFLENVQKLVDTNDEKQPEAVCLSLWERIMKLIYNAA